MFSNRNNRSLVVCMGEESSAQEPGAELLLVASLLRALPAQRSASPHAAPAISPVYRRISVTGETKQRRSNYSI